MILAIALAWAGARMVPPGQVQGAEAVFTGHRIALIIGPSSFADPAFAPLRYPDDDARALAIALADPARGHFDQIWTLTSPDDTSLAGVRAAMAAVSKAVQSPLDTVVVYVSTHGTLAREGSRLSPWLVLSDTRLDAVATTGMPQSRLLDWLDHLPSRRRVAIFATCHSGQGKSVLSADVGAQLASTKGPALSPLREVSEATVVIGVCAMDETARESDQLGHDVYTWYLLDALAHGDADHDGAVTATEAHEHARAGAYTFTGGSQRAWAHAEVLGEDPIVLSGSRSGRGAAVVGSYRAALDGYQLRVDGETKGALPGQFVLPDGPHRLELLDGDRVLARQRVSLPPGRRVDVEALLGRDHVRVAAGLGATAFGIGPASALTAAGELDLPRVLGGGWELYGQGATTLVWPRPTLSALVAVEHPLWAGPVQARAGLGLQGWLLQGDGLLAPSVSPAPVLSVTWLPQGPVWARVQATGGLLWYTDAGSANVGWNAQVGCTVGYRR